MTIVSDTISYRRDGSVASVTRVKEVVFTGPNGETLARQVTETVPVEAIRDFVGDAADVNAENKRLHEAVVAQREEMKALQAKYGALLNVVTTMREADAQYDARIRSLFQPAEA